MEFENDPIASLIKTYHELNPSIIDELSSMPSPLEFMRYVAQNRPFVVRKGAAEWTAVRKWDANYLRDAMQGQHVKVAVTPHGNADSVVEDPPGTLTFVEPLEISEPFSDFLSSIQSSSSSTTRNLLNPDPNPQNPVKYAQTQNNNLPTEYSPLLPDVPPSIPFATTALSRPPEAVNFWLGNARTTTALHKDNYENVYVQVRGWKYFTLLPPVEMACVNEQVLPLGRYALRQRIEGRMKAEDLVVRVEESGERNEVPVAVWDPDRPEKRATGYSSLSRGLRVELGEGDVMYLPALWYHKVGQGEGEEGFACSVNYWYDMEFGGGFWTTNAFVRDVVLGEDKKVKYPALALDDDGAEGT